MLRRNTWAFMILDGLNFLNLMKKIVQAAPKAACTIFGFDNVNGFP